ncbi:MAG: AMP-binding protein [Spirochaetes bacterium]|nr:AMP-binding protein [Spirochaetota bacterium]
MAERIALEGYLNLMQEWGSRIYLVGRDGYRSNPWRFDEVQRASLGFSGALKKAGLKKGERVILGLRPGPSWVIAFFSVLHRGGVVVPIEPDSPQSLLREIVKQTEPSFVISGSKTDPAALSSRHAVCVTEEDIAACREGPPGIPEPVALSDQAEIVYTSGTTANPKGVVLTHGNILADLKPLEEGIERRKRLIRLCTPLRILCCVPYSHMFGQIAGIFLPVLIGSTVYEAADNDPASLIRQIKRNRIISLITVPRVMRLMKDHFYSFLRANGRMEGFERRYDRLVSLPYPLRWPFFLDVRRFFGLSFWSFIVGGAPLDPDTHEFWRRLVYAVFQGYGLTETAPIVSMFSPFGHDRASVGRVFPGQSVRISKEGEIQVRGKNVMEGYYKDPEKTAQVLRDGWLSTGDMGTVGEDGLLYIRGRKKEMIVTPDGRNVFASDVEEALGRVDGVRDSLVFGMPHKSGETVHAVLLLDESIEPVEAVRTANNSLLPFQKIKGYTVWDAPDFPRTPTLKIRREEVLSRVQSAHAVIQSDNPLEKLIPPDAAPESRLADDLGLDSLDRIELVLRLEQEYGTSLDESDISPHTTLGDLEKLAQHPRPHTALKMPRWNRSLPVRVVRRLLLDGALLPVMRLFCRLETEGLEWIEKGERERILVSNHTSHLDPVAILLALPVRYRKLLCPAMGLNRFGARFAGYTTGPRGEDTGNRIKRFFAGLAYRTVTLLFQTYPFPQGAAYRPSLEYTGELLDAGRWVLVFPEGEVSSDGRVHEFKKGIGMIAAQTRSPVYTVCIDGMEKVLPPGARFLRRGRVVVRFGAPVEYAEEGYDVFAGRLENAVRELKIERSVSIRP